MIFIRSCNCEAGYDPESSNNTVKNYLLKKLNTAKSCGKGPRETQNHTGTFAFLSDFALFSK